MFIGFRSAQVPKTMCFYYWSVLLCLTTSSHSSSIFIITVLYLVPVSSTFNSYIPVATTGRYTARRNTVRDALSNTDYRQSNIGKILIPETDGTIHNTVRGLNKPSVSRLEAMSIPKSQRPSLSSSFWLYLIPIYVGWRIWLSNRMPLMDCDEVYNYWEPLHFLLYSSGFQTWEYANEYALRTYAYLTPLWAIAKAYQPLVSFLPDWWWSLLTSQEVAAGDISSKVALFTLLRATLAASMALAEVFFCKAVSEYNVKNSPSSVVIGIVTGGLLLSSAGMSHASGALLPSSTLTLLWLVGAAAFLRQQHTLFIFAAVTATLAIGWPFGVLMFLPLGLNVLFRELKRPMGIATKIIAITGLIQAFVMAIDYTHYGRLVSPTWNILLYNTKAGGDELYGVEPFSYYVKNLILNFNYAILGIFSLPVLLSKRRDALLVTLSPMYLWLFVVAPRPHKEERFLFPIYPCICLAAALAAVTVVDGSFYFLNKSKPGTGVSLMIQGIIWVPAALLSMSRTLALSKYYTAPLHVYAELQKQPYIVEATICTCGEWYRFPSSFYIPTIADSFGFLPSSFSGQLPQPFTSDGSGPDMSTTFNDQNKPEPGSYISTIDDCDYLIDLWDSTDCRENDSEWKPVVLNSFLDAERTAVLHRALYIPFLHEQEDRRGGVEYTDYVLYQRRV